MKIVVTKDTIIKPSTDQSSTLETSKLQTVTRNLVFLVEDGEINGHYKLKGKELYIYTACCKIIEEPQDPWVEIAAKFIAKFEGFRPYAYYLPGEPTWTIGYGTTKIKGVSVKGGDVISQLNAIKYLKEDINEFGDQVKKNLPNWNQLTNNQRAAMVSFAYNIGIGGFMASSARQDAVNKRNPRASLALWNKGSNKQVMQGLVERRKAEADLYDLV